MENNKAMQSGESKSKLLWWVVGIIIVLAIGYLTVKYFGSNDSGTATGSEGLSASDLADIPATGEALVAETVTDESDDVNFGEELV